MAYIKTRWINNQTKLSATNFNHMEQGIEDAHVIAESAKDKANGAFELAHEAKEIAENIDLSGKQDVLESGVNIKTINGKSILGEGDLPIEEGEQVNYQELVDVSLDELTDTGIYSITGALDYPEGTADEGILHVQKLSDEKVEQEWKSKENSAQRILVAGSVAGNKFYVNDEEKPQGEIELAAGGTYELRGNLQGNIIIGGAAANRTKLILDGVNIQSALADSIINYIPEESKLAIEIANGTENYLVVDKEGAIGENDLGVINSNNNLMITGVGYLTILNGKGHGIKAKELIIDGEPHVYLNTNHDAVHGGKLLKITDGYFVVDGANDAFSASAGTSDTGKLLIYGGTYIINNCKESAFEGKSANGVKRILDANITFGDNINKLFTADSASDPKYAIKVYQGLNTIVNNSGKTYTEVDMADDFEGEPSIVLGSTIIEPVSHVFTLTEPGKYTISGDFSDYRIISNPPAGEKIDLILGGDVYYNNSEELMPFVEHASVDKRIKFDTPKNEEFIGKLCYIKKAYGNIIQSASSVQIDGKADFVIRGAADGTGISAPDGYVLLANDAMRRITHCQYGIKADNLRLGKDLEDVADGKYSTCDTAIYAVGNDLDIQSNSLSGDYDEFYEHASIVAPQYHTGIAMLGRITPSNIKIEAQTGIIAGGNYSNSAIVYADTDTGTQININRYTALVGVKDEVPSIEPGITSPWTVYAGDGYSKAESDARYVLKTDYIAKVAELTTEISKVQAKANLLEDRFAAEIYPTYPKITFAVDNVDISNVRVVRGNTSTDAIPLFSNVVVAYDKNGNGYAPAGDDAQFNMLVDMAEGKKPDDTTPKSDAYNKREATKEGTTGNTWRIKYTKVNEDFSINIVAVDDIPASEEPQE